MICIAGMPRSGTSLVTQLLHRSGLYLGESGDMMPAAVDNTDGYWENLLFVRINERLLAAGGGAWYAPPPGIRSTPRIDRDAQAAIARFDGREPWGWKDPRNALTVSFWRERMPSMKVILCVRHPAEAAASLAASTLIPPSVLFVRKVAAAAPLHRRLALALRTTLSAAARLRLIHEVGLEMWRTYNTRLLEQSGGMDVLVTHYEDHLATPRESLERVLAFAGLPLTARALEAIADVPKPRLRHQCAGDAALDPALASLYDRLCHQARRP